MSPAEIHQLLKDTCSRLSEHVDTVQVIVTRHSESENDGTLRASWGHGNWYARYGSVKEQLVHMEKNLEPEEEEDDDS